MSEGISAGRAVAIGTMWVNLPVIAIMIGGWFVLPFVGALVLPHLTIKSVGPVVVLVTMACWFFVPSLAAWLWWSFNTPKWRLWAMERTDDWQELDREAIAAGLIWNERTPWGGLFALTEIWTTRDRQREAQLRRSKS